MALVILLVATMAIPAVAVSQSGTYNGYSYTWYITQTETAGTTDVLLFGKPTDVRAKVTCKVYDDLNNKTRYPVSDVSGYANATAIVSHIIDISEEGDPEPTWVRGTIEYTIGSAWIGGFPLVENYYIT